MKTMLIQYRTRPEHTAANQAAIEAVFAALAATPIAGLDYRALRDGDAFTHVVTYTGEASPDALQALPAFRAFVEGLRARAVEPARRTEVAMIGRHAG